MFRNQIRSRPEVRYNRTMKFIYILENESKFRDEMVEAIRKIDPKLSIRWFVSLEQFAQWIRTVIYEGSAALSKGGTAVEGNPPATPDSTDQLSLVISKNEFFGAKDMALLRKTRDLFIKKNLCTATDPTSLVITSFESPDFDIKLVEDRIINNVLFKPFDKLILQQHLAFAISGRHPPSQYSIHNMKTSATIEMLKEVQIEAMSDVGFVSSSNREIKPGSLAKYYSPAFISLKHKSMMALCLRCEPHPELKDHFRCSFTYLAADPYQITTIRKETRKKEFVPFPYSWEAPKSSARKEILVITLDDELALHFKRSIESRFQNIEVHHYPNLQSLLYSADLELAKKDKLADLGKLPKLPARVDAIFADSTHFDDNFKERWASVLDTLRPKLQPPQTLSTQLDLFVLAKKFYSDPEERALGEIVKDIFFLPIDPAYIAKKLTVFIKGLMPTEELSYSTVLHKHIGKVASPIEISEFSEAGLVLKYYRPISLGAFREFVLWLPHELDLPEFLATANYHEESKNEKGVFFNHFVFFGMNDHFLMHIRRWILQNHVLSKESEAG